MFTLVENTSLFSIKLSVTADNLIPVNFYNKKKFNKFLYMLKLHLKCFASFTLGPASSNREKSRISITHTISIYNY